jgi:hypothetical protein
VDTRPEMGARHYHICDECCGDGKVNTRPRMGTSYYHLIYWNSFLHDSIPLLFLLYFGHGLSLFLFLLHALSMVFYFTYAFEHVFLHSTYPFSRILLERGHSTHRALFCGMDG